MARNISSTLARRRRGDPMRSFDALPADLRAWLRDAALPWSPTSDLKIWNKSCKQGGAAFAIARLSEVEAATLARDRTANPCLQGEIRKTG